MRRLHFAIAQTHSLPGEVEHNLAQIEGFARQASAVGAEFLLTPEMSASGYGVLPKQLANAEVAGDGPIYRRLACWAASTGVIISAGFIEQLGAKKHIAQYAIFPNGEFVVQRKHTVCPQEKPLDVYPEERVYFPVNGIRCNIVICADSGLPNLGEKLQAGGCELMLGVSGGGGGRECVLTLAELADPQNHEFYLKKLSEVYLPTGAIQQALCYGHALAAINLVGVNGYGHFNRGHGFIITREGLMAALIPGAPIVEHMKPQMAHAVLEFPD
ncbi:MAG: carbon-nitrogen hydrolase family protein [Armatimonadota bacterium]